MEHVNIAATFRRYRRAAGLTQQDLAARSGVSVSSISNLERGVWHDPRPDTVELLVNALELTDAERGDFLAALRRHFLASPVAQIMAMLSAPPAILIGRDALLTQLRGRLAQEPRVALYGLPGVGKTALSLALAHDLPLQAQFEGILWAGLGQAPNLLTIFQRWGRLLGLATVATQAVTDFSAWAEIFRDVIGARRILIILDDVWQIEHAYACQVGGNTCQYVLTTRSPELAVQFAGAAIVRVSELEVSDGVTLLRHFMPPMRDSESQEVLQVVHEVGGLPLALTLMGKYLQQQTYSGQSRRSNMALQHLHENIVRMRLSQLQSSLEAHPSIPANTPISLQASIELSVAALPEAAQTMLIALGLFPPKPLTFSEHVALIVSAGTAEMLDKIVDAGLVETVAADRFQVHQTIADYARLRPPHADAEQRFIEWAVETIVTHQYQEMHLEYELHLFVAALQLAAAGKQWELFLRGIIALSPYLISRGFYSTSVELLQQAQHVAEEHEQSSYLIETIFLLSALREKQGNYDQAETLLHPALRIARAENDSLGLSKLLMSFGILLSHRGELVQAQQIMEEALEQARKGSSSELQARVLSNLAAIVAEGGQWERAEHYYHETLALARPLDLTRVQCAVWEGLAQIALRRNHYADAQHALEHSITVARRCNYDELLGNSLTNLGVLYLDQGKFDHAEATFIEAFTLAKKLGHREHICRALLNLSEVRWQQGRLSQAEQALEKAYALAVHLHHQHYLCHCLRVSGSLQLQQGSLEQAAATVAQGIAIARAADYRWVLCALLVLTGDVHLAQQHEHEAQVKYEEALSLARAIASAELEAAVWYGLARLALMQEKIEEARRLGTMSEQLYTTHGLYQAEVVHNWLVGLPQNAEKP